MRTITMLRTGLVAGLLYPLNTFAQVSSCYVKLGGVYFHDCPAIVAAHDQDIFGFAGWKDERMLVDLAVYSRDGVHEAQVTGGKLVKGNASVFRIIAKADEWTISDERTGRIICLVKKVAVDNKKAGCQVNAWLDAWMPGDMLFRGDPESCNQRIFDGAKGATLERAWKAFNFQ